MNGFRYQFDKFVFSDNRKKGVKNFTISLITIFLSMIIAVLICMAIYKKGSLFADIFNVIFTNPFSSSGQVDYLITNIAIFAVAACSFLFAFKSGLFNIGISGQMLFGAMIATIVGQRIGQNATGGYIVPFGLGQIIIVLIAVISGGLVGGLIGLLKAKLNMNEVVSSIMLNWIIYFAGTFMVKSTCKIADSQINTVPLSDNLLLRANGQSFIPLIILAILVVAFTFIVFRFLVFGKKLTNVGMSMDGSKFAGNRVQTNLLLSMLISGMIAGLLGAMVYCGENASVPTEVTAKALPNEGFNGISVGLIAMGNPLGVIPVSILFGIVETSKAAIGTTCGVDINITNLMFGIIVYGAAVISMFYYVKPWKWIMALSYKKRKISFEEHEFNVENQINSYGDAIFLINKKYWDYKVRKSLIKYYSNPILEELGINDDSVTTLKSRRVLLNKIYQHYAANRLSKGEK